MKIETLMVLMNFIPENIKINHPFWKKILITEENIEVKNLKFNKLEKKLKYFKENWRYHRNIILDFYNYLRLNFPNPIPFPLFFSCNSESSGFSDYFEYNEGEIFSSNEEDIIDKKNEHEELQFKESVYYSVENDKYDDYYDYYEDNGNYEDPYIFNEKRIIDLADKWLKDILSGESFYKCNKDYFTRAEVKDFLTCEWIELDSKNIFLPDKNDLINYYWKSKMKTNELNFEYSYFVNKFIEHNGNKLVNDYFKFICMNKYFIRGFDEINDYGDYIFSNAFYGDFTTMTWQDLRHFSNEWHNNFHRNDYNVDFMSTLFKPKLNKKWNKKTAINDSEFTSDNSEWTINEIISDTLLYEEGEEMHNCVFSYLENCLSGQCAIFSVKSNGKRKATLEVRMNDSKYQIVQAREKMNAPIKDNAIKSIIILWAKENNILIHENILNNNYEEQFANNAFIVDDNNRFYEENGHDDQLDMNIAIANDDDELEKLEDEIYARLYDTFIENINNIE